MDEPRPVTIVGPFGWDGGFSVSKITLNTTSVQVMAGPLGAVRIYRLTTAGAPRRSRWQRIRRFLRLG